MLSLRRSLLTVLLLLPLLTAVAFGAVVPDGDNLPQDVGAPTLPGGKRDTAKSKSGSIGASPSPGGATSMTPSPGVASSPSSSARPGVAPPGVVGKDAQPPAGKKSLDLSGSSGSGSAGEAPSASYYALGGVLLAFVVLIGWKLRQDDPEE